MSLKLLIASFLLLSLQATIAQIKSKPKAPLQRNAVIMPVIKDDPSPTRMVRLKEDTGHILPQLFYIQNVIAKDNIDSSLGFLIQPKSGKQQPVQFENNTIPTITTWVNNKIKKDTTLYPLTLKIEKLHFEETKEADLRRSGVYSYNFIIEFNKNGKAIANNDGKYEYNLHAIHKLDLDSIIKVSLNNTLKGIDRIIEESIEESPVFCKNVKVNLSYKTESSQNTDTIFFNALSKLQWDDFKAGSTGVDNYYRQYIGQYFYPDIDYKNGSFHITVQLGAYFVKSVSFAGKKTKTPVLLNHLNYRFKATWLQAVRLKKKLEAFTFSCDNYAKELDKLVMESTKQLSYVLEEYEKETLNGANKKEQLRWEDFFDKQYSEYEIIK